MDLETRPALDTTQAAAVFERIVANVALVLQGNDDAIRLAVTCLVAEGHLLIEDVPGVGKTSLGKALAASIASNHRRIQFTSDLLPTDVTGVSVFDAATGRFEFKPGPIFANVVLGDEINRTPPKTQSALLEAMEEGQVTVDGTTYGLPSPFMVIATQNPIEHEGTYPLPISQLDRFLVRIELGYPDAAAEVTMLETHGVFEPLDDLEPVATSDDVVVLAERARGVFVAPAIQDYIVQIANATRTHPAISLGISPRAALALRARHAGVGGARGPRLRRARRREAPRARRGQPSHRAARLDRAHPRAGPGRAGGDPSPRPRARPAARAALRRRPC